MERQWLVVDRRALVMPWVRVGAHVVGVIGAVLCEEAFRTNTVWVGIAGIAFLVAALVLLPPRSKATSQR